MTGSPQPTDAFVGLDLQEQPARRQPVGRQFRNFHQITSEDFCAR